jgi:hypothetical protein
VKLRRVFSFDTRDQTGYRPASVNRRALLLLARGRLRLACYCFGVSYDPAISSQSRGLLPDRPAMTQRRTWIRFAYSASTSAGIVGQ